MSGLARSTDTGRWLMIAAGVVVLATVLAAVLVMDSPGKQRAERMDRIRVSDLEMLESRVSSHFQVHGELPGQLAVVSGGPGRAIVDPATGRPYQYEIIDAHGYRLCATFETETDEASSVYRDNWRHAAGRHCFDLKVDAD